LVEIDSLSDSSTDSRKLGVDRNSSAISIKHTIKLITLELLRHCMALDALHMPAHSMLGKNNNSCGNAGMAGAVARMTDEDGFMVSKRTGRVCEWASERVNGRTNR
jgi:hypothetical protein